MILPFSRAAGALLCIALGVFAGGCGSMSSIDLPNLNYSQTRAFEKDADMLFDACQATLGDMNYFLVRGSRAGGKLEMASRVQPGSALRARQRNVEIEITSIDVGESEMKIVFKEASQDESAAGTVTTTNRVIRDGTLYQVFWERLAEKLGLPPPPPQAGAL